MAVGNVFPPTQTPPIDVFDLTEEEESPAPLPKSGPQQATQEQANHHIEDGNDQDSETVTHQASTEHIKEPDIIQNAGRDNGQESVDSVSALGSLPSAQSPSNAVPTSRESCGMQAARLSCCSNASSQDEPEPEPDSQSARSDGGLCIELPMDDGEDTLPDEWEGKIIGEDDKYLVAWENSFIPKENASAAMVQTWMEKKTEIRGAGTKFMRATIEGRVQKRGKAPVKKRGRGRPHVKRPTS
ncbi:hypothetical protein V8F06_008567 [Rhypophila decipiens]